MSCRAHLIVEGASYISYLEYLLWVLSDLLSHSLGMGHCHVGTVMQALFHPVSVSIIFKAGKTSSGSKQTVSQSFRGQTDCFPILQGLLDF